MTLDKDHPTVESFEQFPDSAYERAALAPLATYAVKRLIDLHIPTTFENIVVVLFKMFPRKFGLIGFEQYPDAACVGRTLLQLGPKYRNWARGSVQKGFVLTESGLARAAEVSKDLVSADTPSGVVRSKKQVLLRTMDLGKDIRGIEESSLFRRWKSGTLNEGKSIELFDLLGAYAYTPAKVLRGRLADIRNIVEQVGRSDLSEFLHAVRDAFDAQLSDQEK